MTHPFYQPLSYKNRTYATGGETIFATGGENDVIQATGGEPSSPTHLATRGGSKTETKSKIANKIFIIFILIPFSQLSNWRAYQ